ncbi:MAG: hypothetical protein JNL18_17910 [Planctomycetaceae bacterium]|nr:hypothetical protein [Planctomycetaceae bacterium]
MTQTLETLNASSKALLVPIKFDACPASFIARLDPISDQNELVNGPPVAHRGCTSCFQFDQDHRGEDEQIESVFGAVAERLRFSFQDANGSLVLLGTVEGFKQVGFQTVSGGVSET